MTYPTRTALALSTIFSGSAAAAYAMATACSVNPPQPPKRVRLSPHPSSGEMMDTPGSRIPSSRLLQWLDRHFIMPRLVRRSIRQLGEP